jgi:hypothetical protein
MSELDEFKAPKPAATAPAPRWKISFADLLSVMISFFVLLLAAHSMTQDQLKQISDAFIKRTTILFSEVRPADRSVQVRLPTGINLDYLKSVIEATFGSWDSLKSIPIKRLDTRLAIQLPYDKLVSPEGKLLATRNDGLVPDLASALTRINNQIQVLALVPGRDANNLGLAMMISGGLAMEMRGAGYPDEIPFVAGYAPGQADAERQLLLVVLPAARNAR